MKLLCISHDNNIWGAPRSLAGIMAELEKTTDWDIQVLVRSRSSHGRIIDFGANHKTTFWQPAVKQGVNNNQSRPNARMILGSIKRLRIGKALKMAKFWACSAFEKSEDEHHKDVAKKMRKWAPDVIYSNTAVNMDVLAALAIDAPVVVHVRELDWFLSALSPEAKRIFQTVPEKYLCVSNAVKTNLIENYDIPADRCHIVPVGLNVDMIMNSAAERSPESVRGELGLKEDDFVITMCGTLDKRKGWELVVGACRHLTSMCGTGSKPCFVWIGDGGDRAEFEQAMHEAGWDSRLRITGATKNPYVYMAAADLQLTPSLDDPFPRVNLEAACLGKPVVAFKPSGGSAEFVGNDAGVVVNSFDAEELAQVLLNAKLGKLDLEGMGQAGSRKVKRSYTVERVSSLAREYIRTAASAPAAD